MGLPSAFIRCAAILLLMATVIAASKSCVAARIPDVHGASLTNETITLPGDLRGRPAILILGFSRGSRDGVADWGHRLAADYRNTPAVMYYEMPVLASVPAIMRGFVVRSMKSSVPQRAQARFVPIIDHEAEWRALAHYGQADDPYLLVVDGGEMWFGRRRASPRIGICRAEAAGGGSDAKWYEVALWSVLPVVECRRRVLSFYGQHSPEIQKDVPLWQKLQLNFARPL